MSEKLKSMFIKFIDEYADELDAANATKNYKRPFGDFVRKDIVSVLRENISNPNYLVKGSVGVGHWTNVPWIGIFDKRITTTAQKGVYIVYLLNKDTKTLYLTLNQGAMDLAKDKSESKEEKKKFTGIATSTNSKTTEGLHKRARKIRAVLKHDNLHVGPCNSSSKPYDAGCIYYKDYQIDTIPDDEHLIEDLNLFIDIYTDYYRVFYENKSIEQEEQDTSMKKDTLESLQQIESYIATKGFLYEAKLIRNFYLSLKSKPFVILAGTSGTGKTRLVRLFAEAIGATSANGRYCQVAVRPDWSDSTDLFGHVDLNGKFVPGAILPFLKEATGHPNQPYILCLDEMNLARVEYYMSDFLSIIESRDLKDGKIISDLIMTNDKYGNDKEAVATYGEIGFPQNLYIVGTVNMDETTFPFSRKVLDRANTIEFNYVDLGLHFSEPIDVVKPYEADNSFLMSEYLVLNRDCREYFDVIGPICSQLESINKILQKANAHVGYRVRDEIVFYLINNMNAGLLTEVEAFDNCVMQKILPRIQGSSASIKVMLRELFESFAGQKIDANAADSSTATAMQKILDGGTVTYPNSAAKIKFMVQRFEEDGFTSYWL